MSKVKSWFASKHQNAVGNVVHPLQQPSDDISGGVGGTVVVSDGLEGTGAALTPVKVKAADTSITVALAGIAVGAVPQANVAGLTTALASKADKTTTITAGNGLTGGGALGSNIVVNVTAGDNTIIVDADSIKVGIVPASQVEFNTGFEQTHGSIEDSNAQDAIASLAKRDEHRITYGRVALVWRNGGELQSYPLSGSGVLQNNQNRNGSRDVIDAFNNYDRCRWAQHRQDDGIFFEPIKDTFSFVSEIEQWADNNIPNDGISFLSQQAHVVPYDVEDNRIQPLHNIYAFNKTYMRLIRPYAVANITTTRRRSTWNIGGAERHHGDGRAFEWHAEADTLLDAMWTACFGAQLGGGPATWGGRERACFWYSRTTNYRMPSPGNRIADAGRWSIDVTSGSNLQSFNADFFVNEARGRTVYGVWDHASQTLVNVYDRNQFKQLAIDLSNGYSIVAGIPLLNPADDHFGAMLIKPLGVDTAVINSYDHHLTLEAVGTTRSFKKTKIRRLIEEGNLAGFQEHSQHISISRIMQSAQESSSKSNSRYEWGEAHLRLRDAQTWGRVGPLSQAKITTHYRHRFAPIYWLLENK